MAKPFFRTTSGLFAEPMTTIRKRSASTFETLVGAPPVAEEQIVADSVLSHDRGAFAHDRPVFTR